VLLLVLIVIALLSFASLALFERMFAEYRGAGTHGRKMQTRALAESGVEFAKVLVTQDLYTVASMGGLYNNPDRLRAALVVDSDVAALRGRFTLVAPALAYEGYYDGVRYGLENESSRWNLNTLALLDAYGEDAGRLALLRLPNMTEEIADAILDFVDEDTLQRTLGAESEYYSSLPMPYEPVNGPLESVEQLLLVRGVTPELLFGSDTNRNGILEVAEEAVAAQSQLPVALGRGWSAYLTVHSAEKNVRPDGTPKTDINSTDLNQLYSDLRGFLSDDQAKFIIAYRQGGPSDSEDRGTAASSIQLDFNQQGGTNVGSLLDLVGAKTQMPAEQQGEDPTIIEPAFPEDPSAMQTYLPKLFDNLMVGTQPMVPGRININQASRPVLEGLPDIQPLAVEQILDRRLPDRNPADPSRSHPTWLLTEGILQLDEMKRLAPLLSCGGDVYRIEAVGFFEAEGPSSRIEVILDATQPVPLVRSWRDLRELGLGYTTEVLIGEPLPTN
jgi:hypothetical protein